MGRKKEKTEVKKVKEKRENDNEFEDIVTFLSNLSPPKPKYNFTSIVVCPFHNNEYSGITIHWTCEDHGFGKITFYISDGKIELDSHYSNPEFVAELLKAAVMKIIGKIEVVG